MFAPEGFPPNLPADPLGWVASPDYKSPLRAGVHNNKGTGNAFTSPCLGRTLEALSDLEANTFRLGHMNRHVLDIRDQYPACSVKEYEALRGRGAIRKSDLPFLDSVWTVGSREGMGPLRYFAVNVKLAEDLKNLNVLKRMARERKFCADVGFGWQLVTEHELPSIAVENALLLLAWAKVETVDRSYAEEFARRFVASHRSAETLEVLLRRASRTIRLTADSTKATFAHAVLHGFVPVDLRKPIRPASRLTLQ